MKEYLDNLKTVLYYMDVTHESLAMALGKDRSVITKKLNGQIPFTVDEYLAVVSHLGLDLFSLLMAQSEEQLQELALMKFLKIEKPEIEMPELIKRFRERYGDALPEDKRNVFYFLIDQLLALFPPIDQPK